MHVFCMFKFYDLKKGQYLRFYLEAPWLNFTFFNDPNKYNKILELDFQIIVHIT